MSTWLGRNWEILIVLFALYAAGVFGFVMWAVKRGWLIER